MISAARKNVDDDNLPIVFAVKMGNLAVGRRRNGLRMTAESMSSLVEPHRVPGLEDAISVTRGSPSRNSRIR